MRMRYAMLLKVITGQGRTGTKISALFCLRAVTQHNLDSGHIPRDKEKKNNALHLTIHVNVPDTSPWHHSNDVTTTHKAYPSLFVELCWPQSQKLSTPTGAEHMESTNATHSSIQMSSVYLSGASADTCPGHPGFG